MLLFVYGPYMNPEYLRQRGVTILEGRGAVLPGYEICFSTRTDDWKQAMIDICESPKGRVEGVLYEITDDAMRILDRHERVVQGYHMRIRVQVQTAEKTSISAYAFVCPVKEGKFTPSTDYLNVIAEGAELNGLTREYIEYIKSFAQKASQDHLSSKE